MKEKVLLAIIKVLESELASVSQAARAAHEAATHEESRAEDQHDTRGIEASYLAGAQAKRASEIQQALMSFRSLDIAAGKARIEPGALVEIATDGKKTWALFASHGGGIQVRIDGVSVRVVSPQSPLGEELAGRKVGDAFELETQGTERAYEVLQVE